MPSKTQIVNLALQRIGHSQIVANVDFEQSRAALSAKLLFDDERDFVLRDFPWPFATRYATLGLVAGSSTTRATADWLYAYRYPSDAISIRRIPSPSGRQHTSRIAFRIGSDAQGRLIYTDLATATVEYTGRVTDPETFDPLFTSMLAWKLAASLAPALSRIENIAMTAMQMYAIDRSTAESRAFNESHADPAPDAEWIRARG